jgi:hypothetical protein
MDQYKGMSYEDASREAAKLIMGAVSTGGWFHIVEKLAALREVMVQAKVAA